MYQKLRIQLLLPHVGLTHLLLAPAELPRKKRGYKKFSGARSACALLSFSLPSIALFNAAFPCYKRRKPCENRSFSTLFACGKFGESFKAGGKHPCLPSCARLSRRFLSSLLTGRLRRDCSSPPVMAWRHPDVCNRHQKSFRPGRGERSPRGFSLPLVPVSSGKSLRSLLRKT
ncbi:hypothetical protein HDV57DRAFT_348085 [Trichoderma longibrachiatum]